ncbi:MAG: nucleotidyltransferase domain-containing protein [Lachnospiraceae bacterium]|nr:nucleotidyltransferase domain-containing protein [Oribacterium sp.]MEE3462316.1 nucleotidyltransferase domain-containing protein [Lachnospiraceae bacterium]
MTLSVNQISDGVKAVVDQYPIKKVTLFGSYANGSFDENSDVDLLVEFKTENVSLLLLSKLKYEMEDRLGKDVDIIHGPLDDNAMIEIDKEIPIYES